MQAKVRYFHVAYMGLIKLLLLVTLLYSILNLKRKIVQQCLKRHLLDTVEFCFKQNVGNAKIPKALTAYGIT